MAQQGLAWPGDGDLAAAVAMSSERNHGAAEGESLRLIFFPPNFIWRLFSGMRES
jgi:hypothetical protein